jgi:hypothetical protein
MFDTSNDMEAIVTVWKPRIPDTLEIQYKLDTLKKINLSDNIGFEEIKKYIIQMMEYTESEIIISNLCDDYSLKSYIK